MVQEGERNSRRDVRPDTGGGKETGGTGQYGSGLVDLEKAFDTVPREVVMATLRWMGVPEAEVGMVEDRYEKTTARVVVGEGASDEFEVNIGLRQGSVLSPLLSIAVLDLISRKMVMKDAMKKLLLCRRPYPWWRMANWSYLRNWRSGMGCLPDQG